MPISGLRILPPFAVGRFGSSPNPLEAYDLAAKPDAPLAFRQIHPRDTLEVDPSSGAVVRKYIPESIRFRDGDRIRPVAPFLEVFAQTDENRLEPLTLGLLRGEGLNPDAVHWTVSVANLKVFRQTGDPNDQVSASVENFNDHAAHELRGTAVNFLAGKHIPFGNVRYIKPTNKFPEIRLRFTPAAGRVYGSSLIRLELDRRVGGRIDTIKPVSDPVFAGDESRIVYDAGRGTWRNFQADVRSRTLPNPSDIYHGYWPATEDLPISWGYLDDVCDGRVSVQMTLPNGQRWVASAWISSCMPAFAPDSQPIRTVADELEQLILGPDIRDDEISIYDAAEILRRSLETIRLMNTAAMNANTMNGRPNAAATLFRQDTNDYGRHYAPAMASSLVDNLAVRALHERIFSALQSGCAPWFADVLRRPEEIGDLSDQGRRKMPPMLRGSDGRALTLTRRQISKIVSAATAGMFKHATHREPVI